MGHFVSSPREREKKDRRDSRGDEREGQGRKRNRNESEETEEIKTSPSTGLSVQEKKRKVDFQDSCHGAHPGFTIGMILAIFDLQVTPMLPTKFGVNLPFGSGEEAKNRFSRRLPWRPSWISDRHDFSYF